MSQDCPHKTEVYRIVNQWFATKCQKNTSYSVRAFARDLECSPAFISDILNEKKGISPKTSQKLSGKIYNNADESQYFINLCNAAFSRSLETKKGAAKEVARYRAIKKYQIIKEDMFKIIGDWQSFAVLESIDILGDRADEQTIGSMLDLETAQTKLILRRLTNVGLVKTGSNGVFVTIQNTETTQDIPSSVIQNYHRGMLNKAENALSKTSVKEREFQSNMFSMNWSQFEKLKEVVRNFGKETIDTFLSQGDLDRIVAMNIQVFPISKTKDCTKNLSNILNED